MVGGIAFLLLVACLVFLLSKRRKRGAEGLPRLVPYIAVQRTPGTSDPRPIEKGKRAGAGVATRLGTQQRLGRNSTASGSGAEATDLRNQVDNLQREMAEMRAQREHDKQLPPLYGQI